MAVYNQTVLTPDPLYLQPKSYDARSDRKWFSSLLSEGVEGAGDFAVTVPGSPTNLTLNVAAGVAYVKGKNIVDQGMYRQFISSPTTVVAPAAHATLPRIDTVIMRIMDNAADASGFNEARIEVVPGTATSGATLANGNGKNPLTSLGEASTSWIVLAYILVPAAATAFTNTATNVSDIRARSQVGAGLSAIAGGVPIGASLEWNSTTLPPSNEGTYLVEDGSAISRTTYSTAFTRLGTGAGTGDGSTTFNIPDSRGRVPVGYAPSGGHSDVSTMFGTEGLAVAFRRTRHRTTNSLTLPNHVHNGDDGTGFWIVGSGTTTFQVVSGGFNPHGGNSGNPTTLPSIGGSIGTNNANDALDTAAYVVKNKIIRVA